MSSNIPSNAACTLLLRVEVRADTDPGPEAPDGGLVWDITSTITKPCEEEVCVKNWLIRTAINHRRDTLYEIK